MLTRRSLALAAFAAVAALAGADDKKPAKLDPEKLVGKYAFTSGEKYGTALPADQITKATMEIEKDKMTMPTPDGKFVFAYKVDASTEPAGLDLEITDGPIGKGSKSKGIIKMDGDTVTICYPSEDGAARPKEFKSTDAAKTLLFVLKKAEKGK